MQQDVILILGASSDIGKGLIQKICECQKTPFVILAHYHNTPPIENDHIIGIKCDLGSSQEVLKMIKKIETFGLPNKIIHLANPHIKQQHFKKIKWEDFNHQFHIAFKGIFLILQYFLPLLSKQKSLAKKVIFMLSSYTLAKPPMGMADYVSIKYALLGLMKSLASEYKNIQFNALSPSMIETKFLDQVDERVIALNAQNHPLGRNARVEDILESLYLLMGNGSDYISGVNLPITGGEIF